MKGFNLQAIVDTIAAIYKAFFKGKTVGGVVLPSQGQGAPPLEPSATHPRTGMDDQPHRIEPPKPGGGRWPA